MQAYSGLSCTIHLDIGLYRQRTLCRYKQVDYETITYKGKQRRLQVYPHVHVSAAVAIV